VYYFRVIQAIYFKEQVAGANHEMDVTKSFKYLLIIAAAILIIAGILPSLVVDWLYY
jgi:NADH-quinone oxidoreductase subunit N